MDKDLQTDAAAESGGAVGGSTSGPSQSKPLTTTTHVNFTASDGCSYQVHMSGAAPNVQIGSFNTMHVVDKALYMGPTRKTKIRMNPKLPLLKSTDIPNTDAMDIVARDIARDWKALGRKLGLTDGELDNIKIDYYNQGQYEVSYQMIRKWKETAYPTELWKLAKACATIGRGDIADSLAERFGDE